MPACTQREVARDAAEEIREMDFLEAQFIRLRFHAREHQQILDERGESLRVAVQHLKRLGLLPARHVGHVHELLDIALKNRERCAQLVRDIRDKFAPHFLEPLRVPDVTEHRERRGLAARIAHRCDAHGEDHRRLARREIQFRLTRLGFADRGDNHVVHCRLAKKLDHRAARISRREIEKLLRRGIREPHVAPSVEHEHALLHRGQNDFQVRLRKRSLAAQMLMLAQQFLLALRMGRIAPAIRRLTPHPCEDRDQQKESKKPGHQAEQVAPRLFDARQNF